MNELTVTHKLDIKSNMEELAKGIQKDIKLKFDVIVTEDSLPETKKLMAEVNKQKEDFRKKYKEFRGEILAPLAPLDTKAKEIENYFDDARKALSNQVEHFEKGKIEAIRDIVEKYLDDACMKANITSESITVSDLVLLSAVSANSKGYSITKKTSDAIDQRVQAVENQILKAMLEAEEKAKRDREIADNARREVEERAMVRETELLAKAERALLKAEREKAEAVAKATRADNAPVQKPTPQEESPKEPIFADDGKRIFTVTATFEILAPREIDVQRIVSALEQKLKFADITTCKNIEVR